MKTEENDSKVYIIKFPKSSGKKKILKESKKKDTLFTEKQIQGQHISCQEQCNPEKSGRTFIKY